MAWRIVPIQLALCVFLPSFHSWNGVRFDVPVGRIKGLRGGAKSGDATFDSTDDTLLDTTWRTIQQQLSTLRNGVAKAPIKASSGQLHRFRALLNRSHETRGSAVDIEGLEEQTQAARTAFAAADATFLNTLGELGPDIQRDFRTKLSAVGGNMSRCLEEIPDDEEEDEDLGDAGKWQALMDRMPFVGGWQDGEVETAAPAPEQIQFWEAAEEGDVKQLQRLARSGRVGVDLPDPRHYARATALQRAAMMGQAGAMEALVRLGAAAGQQDRHGETALHTAARQHALPAVRCALRLQPALVNTLNCFGQTALMAALDWGGRLCTQELGPEERAGREAALHTTAVALLEGGGDPAAADEAGWTAAHYAARWGRGGLVRMLAAAGADVNARTSDGHTPLDWAAASENHTAAQVLRTLGGQQGEGGPVAEVHGRVESEGESNALQHLEDEEEQDTDQSLSSAPAASRQPAPEQGREEEMELPPEVGDLLDRLEKKLTEMSDGQWEVEEQEVEEEASTEESSL